MYPTGVVDPRHAEDDLAFGLAERFENFGLRVLRGLHQDRTEGLEDFVHGLVELGLAGVSLHDRLKMLLEVRCQITHRRSLSGHLPPATPRPMEHLPERPHQS